MKKMLLSCVLTVILSVLLTGCAKEDQVSEKLCCIEISDALEHSKVVVLKHSGKQTCPNFLTRTIGRKLLKTTEN